MLGIPANDLVWRIIDEKKHRNITTETPIEDTILAVLEALAEEDVSGPAVESPIQTPRLTPVEALLPEGEASP